MINRLRDALALRKSTANREEEFFKGANAAASASIYKLVPRLNEDGSMQFSLEEVGLVAGVRYLSVDECYKAFGHAFYSQNCDTVLRRYVAGNVPSQDFGEARKRPAMLFSTCIPLEGCLLKSRKTGPLMSPKQFDALTDWPNATTENIPKQYAEDTRVDRETTKLVCKKFRTEQLLVGDTCVDFRCKTINENLHQLHQRCKAQAIANHQEKCCKSANPVPYRECQKCRVVELGKNCPTCKGMVPLHKPELPVQLCVTCQKTASAMHADGRRRNTCIGDAILCSQCQHEATDMHSRFCSPCQECEARRLVINELEPFRVAVPTCPEVFRAVDWPRRGAAIQGCSDQDIAREALVKVWKQVTLEAEMCEVADTVPASDTTVDMAGAWRAVLDWETYEKGNPVLIFQKVYFSPKGVVQDHLLRSPNRKLSDVRFDRVSGSRLGNKCKVLEVRVLIWSAHYMLGRKHQEALKCIIQEKARVAQCRLDMRFIQRGKEDEQGFPLFRKMLPAGIENTCSVNRQDCEECDLCKVNQNKIEEAQTLNEALPELKFGTQSILSRKLSGLRSIHLSRQRPKIKVNDIVSGEYKLNSHHKLQHDLALSRAEIKDCKARQRRMQEQNKTLERVDCGGGDEADSGGIRYSYLADPESAQTPYDLVRPEEEQVRLTSVLRNSKWTLPDIAAPITYVVDK